MNISDIIEASADGPTRLGLHTKEGWGKTTLAGEFPDPIWAAPERGFPRDMRFRPKVIPNLNAWPDFFTAVKMLKTQKHPYRSLVFDTIDWIEPMIHRFVCQRDTGRKTEMNKAGHKLESIEDYGYKAGYIAAEEEFRKLVAELDDLQLTTGMHVVMLMHSKVTKFENPVGPNFDRWEPKMHHRISSVVKEWNEHLLFGYYEIEAGQLGDEKKAKGVSTGKRLIGTRHNAAYDAKNRCKLPDVVEVGDIDWIRDKLVPCLLGDHLDKAKSSPASRPSSVAAAERAKTPEPVEREAEPPRSADYYEQQKNVDGKPAMHADRAAEEKRNLDASMQRTREGNERVEQKARTEADAKREAREWTEPKPASKADAAKSETRQIDAKYESIVKAKAELKQQLAALEKIDKTYATKAQKWAGLAGDDVDKIQSIIDDVKKKLTAKAA